MVSARRSGQRRAAQCVRSRRSGIAGAPGEAAVGGGSETVAVADTCGPSLGETSRRHRETGALQSPPVKLVGLDTGVFVAGVFWRHEPHACVEAWFRGFSGCPNCLVPNAANCVECGLFDQRQRRCLILAWGAAPGIRLPSETKR